MQTAFDLRLASHWGGRRAGAGRPRGPRPRVWHRSRVAFRSSDALHLTLRVRGDVPSLRSVRFVREMEQSLRVLAEKRQDFRVVHYSLQSNHAHFLVEASGRDALGRGAKALGIRLARVANRVFRRRGAVLDDRYHQRVVRAPREARHTIAYVLLNARRHARRPGAVQAAGGTLDPASSARWFDGWRGGAAAAADPPAVSRPRTWILAAGWRRHGRIDPGEVPGGREPRGARAEDPEARPRAPRTGSVERSAGENARVRQRRGPSSGLTPGLPRHPSRAGR